MFRNVIILDPPLLWLPFCPYTYLPRLDPTFLFIGCTFAAKKSFRLTGIHKWQEGMRGYCNLWLRCVEWAREFGFPATVTYFFSRSIISSPSMLVIHSLGRWFSNLIMKCVWERFCNIPFSWTWAGDESVLGFHSLTQYLRCLPWGFINS